jgi:hypothetical protein
MKKSSKWDSYLEKKFKAHWTKYHAPTCRTKIVSQHTFHPTRQWKFDFAFPEVKIAIEIQGVGPGHTSPKGILNDHAKNFEAVRYGWTTIYLMNKMLAPSTITNTVNTIRAIVDHRLLNPVLCEHLRNHKPLLIRNRTLPPELEHQ